MDRASYKLLKSAHRSHPNPLALQKLTGVLPVFQHRVQLLLGKTLPQVALPEVRNRFATLEGTPEYRDALVLTYLLFLGAHLNRVLMAHTFHHPHAQAIFHWLRVYKQIVYSVVVLVYQKTFTDRDWLLLDEMAQQLNEGHAASVRSFLQAIQVLTLKEPVVLEERYPELFTLSSEDFGPFYWQMLHLMALALEVRKGAEEAKTVWRDFTVHLLDRTLICGICAYHYREVVLKKYRDRLERGQGAPELWYEIHNELNRTLKKLELPRAEWERQQETRRALLLAKKVE